MLGLKELLDSAYERRQIAWDTPEIPEELVDYVRDHPGKDKNVLDLGSGSGHYSVFLAGHGYRATSIDISPTAIRYGQQLAKQKRQNITFIEADLRYAPEIEERFDLVLEWGLLHFVLPEFREEYVEWVAMHTKPAGAYMVLTFSDQSQIWGEGKYRVGPTGAPLYFSSRSELEELYRPYFEVVESKLRPTKFANSEESHLEHYFLLKRKQ